MKNEESQSDAPLVCSYTLFTAGAETPKSANELEMEPGVPADIKVKSDKKP